MLLKDKKNILFYGLLMLACLNFMRLGSTLMLIACVYSLLIQSGLKIKINSTGWVYVILTITTVITSMYWYDSFEIIKVLNYGLCYIVGYNSYLIAKDSRMHAQYSFGAMYVGCLVYVVLLIITNINLQSIYRVLIDVWTGEYIAVTLVGVISAIVTGYSVYLFFFGSGNISKIVAVASFSLVVALNFKTATRTVFVLAGLIVVLGYCLKLFNGGAYKKAKYLFSAVVVFVLVLVAYNANFLNIQSSISGSLLLERFLHMDDASVRVDLFLDHMRNAFDYPFGGQKVSAVVGEMAHNVIQDFYDNFGIVPSIFFVAIFINIIRTLVRLALRKNDFSVEKAIVLLCFTMLVQMCTEPIITGYPIFVWLMFMIDGFANAYLYEGAHRG